MNLKIHWLIITTLAATLALVGGCSDEGAECAADEEEACECERQDGSVNDGFRVCDAETEKWGSCTCAPRSARFCNFYFPNDADGNIMSTSCTMTLTGNADTVSYTALNGACDQPPGDFCRPLPPDETLETEIQCVDLADNSLIFATPLVGELTLPGATEDYAITLQDVGFGPEPSGTTFPISGAPGFENEDETYATCEDYTVPSLEEVKDLFE